MEILVDDDNAKGRFINYIIYFQIEMITSSDLISPWIIDCIIYLFVNDLHNGCCHKYEKESTFKDDSRLISLHFMIVQTTWDVIMVLFLLVVKKLFNSSTDQNTDRLTAMKSKTKDDT